MMWAVIIFNRNHRHVEKFGKRKGPYGAVQYKERMEERFSHRSDITVNMINITKATPPEEETKKRKGELYCPYCCKVRKFQIDAYLGKKYCPVCGVSDREFYVRTYNHTWGKAGKKGMRRSNRES